MHSVAHLVHAYGLLVVAGFIGLESMGIPLPGETALIVGSVIAGRTHELNIVAVILTAMAASLIGRTIGYLIGAQFGYWLLLRYRLLSRHHRSADQARPISVPQAWRHDHHHRPVHTGLARDRRRPRRRQSHALAAFPAGQHRRRGPLGDVLRHRRLYVRPAVRSGWPRPGGCSPDRAAGSSSVLPPSSSFSSLPSLSAATRRSLRPRPNAPCPARCVLP